MSPSMQTAVRRVRNIDWTDLNNRTRSYSFEQCAKGEEDAVFCALYLKMSEIVAKINTVTAVSNEEIPFLFVFADTLVLDTFKLPSSSVTIVARCIQVANDEPLVVPGDGLSQLLILTSDVEGPRLRILSEGLPEWAPDLTQPDLKISKSITFVRKTNPRMEVSSDITIIADRLRHPIAWNCLKAEFAAAVLLLERNTANATAAAAEMLRWIQTCTALAAKKDGPFQLEAKDLNYQSAALIVQSSAPGSAAYVPILSKDFYEKRVARLMAVVQAYEAELTKLETLSAVDAVAGNFSETLKSISNANIQSIDSVFDTAMEELAALKQEYNRLVYELYLQDMAVQTAEMHFRIALRMQEFWDKIEMIIGIASAVASLGSSVAGLSTAKTATRADKLLEAIAEHLNIDIDKQAEQVQNVIDKTRTLGQKIMEAGAKGFSKLADLAKSLETLQESIGLLANAAAQFQALYQTVSDAIPVLQGDSGPEIGLPDWANIGSLDPDLEWNAYMAEMDGQLKSYDHVSGIGSYRSTLVTYTEYAKAANRKATAMARVHARLFEIVAQKKAAQQASERWQKMEAEAKNAEQKKAIMLALLEQQVSNAKRSLLVAGRAYRAAYLYRWLSEPTMKVNLEMKHKDLAVEFAKITQDVEALLGAGKPPQAYDTDVIKVPVVRPKTPPGERPDGMYATLTSIDGKRLLTWSMPISGSPFDGKLPPNDRLAVFIDEGWFYLAGAKPNASGTVIVKVTTSGEYANGYGKDAGTARRAFASAPLEMDFIYSVGNDGAANEPPNTPWKPANEIKASYMAPSPFTQFTLSVEDAGSLDELTAIHLRFRGVYHKVAPGV